MASPFRVSSVERVDDRDLDEEVSNDRSAGWGAVAIPPRRLGALLQVLRERRGWELDAQPLLTVCGPGFDLGEAERTGVIAPTDLAALLDLYGMEVGQLTRRSSSLRLERWQRDAPESVVDVAVVGSPARQALLCRYLAAVYRMRNATLGVPLMVRRDDIRVLASALSSAPEAVEAELRNLMSDAPERVAHCAEQLRSTVFMPGAGLLIGESPAGAVCLVQEVKPGEPHLPLVARA